MTVHALGELEIHVEPRASWIEVPASGVRIIASNPGAVAEFVRHGDDGRYRPLSGAKTLPSGWKVFATGKFPLEAAINAVYPLATLHQRQLAAGTLEVVSLDEVLTRQSGRYESTSSLTPAGRSRATTTLCHQCVRLPVWNGAACGPDQIPCPEPCSVMIALCREAALWEADPPVRTPIDSSKPFAAFDEPGNELRERYLSAMIDAQ